MAEAPGILDIQAPPKGLLFWKKDRPIPIPKPPLESEKPKEKPPNPKTQAKERKIKEKLLSASIDNEFEDTGITMLEPMNEVLVLNYGSRFDVRDYLKREFEYYSRTRGLETGTERTKILQEIADRMTEGKIQTRIVIMNKGLEEGAFTYPDGTIFITQSLINSLTSIDEVAGVLAHELGHLIFRTSDKRSSAPNQLCEFGIGWIHEAASDLNAPKLLAKAGLNSSGFSNAIRIISGAERGTIHQTGLSRSAQNIGLHAVIDFETSHLKPSEINPILKTTEVDPTNKEMFSFAFEKLSSEYMKKIISSLHPRDFLNAYKKVTDQPQEYGYSQESKDKTEKQVQMLEAFHDVFRSRLEGKGYSKDEIDLFLLIEQGKNPRSYRFIETPERILQITENLKDFIRNHKAPDMFKSLLDTNDSRYINSSGTALSVFLENLSSDMYEFIPGQERRQTRIPLTEDVLLTVLKRVREFKNSEIASYGETEKAFTQVLNSWIFVKYHEPFNELPADREARLGKAKEFLLKAKALGIEAHSRHLGYNNKYKDLFDEVFGKEKEREALSPKDVIDKFLNDYVNAPDYKDYSSTKRQESKKDYFELFAGWFKLYREDGKLTDQQILSSLEYLDQKLDALQLKASYSVQDFLNDKKIKDADPTEFPVNDRLLKFNLKLNLAMYMFSTDSNEFYDYVSKLIENLGFDVNSLSNTQRINLATPLLEKPKLLPFAPPKEGELIEPHLYEGTLKIKNYEKYAQNPLIAEIIRLNEYPSSTTLHALNFDISQTANGLFEPKLITDLFSDEIGPLIIGRGRRRQFEEILQKGISETDYSELYTFLSTCYSSLDPQIEEFKREINKRFFKSEAPIKEKVDHFIRWEDQLGPEGAIMVGDQIRTMQEYLYFKKRQEEKIQGYLSGESKRTAELAVLDNTSAELVQNFKLLLDSTKTDLPSKTDFNTRLAQEWAEIFDNDYTGDVIYDAESKKIILSGRARTRYKTLSDSIDILRNLTPTQRYLLSHKALLDKGGALTTDENRRLLGDTIVGALKPKVTFISSALRTAAEDSPSPDFISFPAAQMLSGILFEGLDVKSVDPTKVNSEKVPHDELIRIMSSNTREVSLFGARYRGSFDTTFGRVAQESDGQYHRSVDVLKKLLFSTTPQETESQPEISPSTESLIRGVEMTGALGVRSLQLARQLHRFPQDVDRRLSQIFDARQGIPKLSFWYHLDEWSKSGNGIPDFTERLVSLDEYLGGGSLYTTFAGTVRNTDGSTSQVAIKMRTPNTEMFIQEPYKIVGDVLTKIGTQGSAEDKQYAKMSQLFLDLSNRWCLNDINDPTFESDDDNFRQTIDLYNKTSGKNTFYAPDRVFNSPKLKSEEKAPGKTLNQVLNDPSVSNAQKQSLVQTINKFFSYQTKTPVKTTDGKEYFLVHSDPHIGNFMVDLTEDQPRIGVIDRNMYLRLEKEDVALFQPLLEGKGYGSMLEPMIERLLDRNKIVGKADRRAIKNRILFGVRGEFVVQAWESLKHLKLKPDNFAILRRFMGEASQAGLDIPLEYQLMIRNIEAFRELSRRYAA